MRRPKDDFLAVRGITDLVDEDLPDEFNDFLCSGSCGRPGVFQLRARPPRARRSGPTGLSGQASWPAPAAKLARFLEAAVGQPAP
jgi:hypothetical protein